MVSRRLFSWDDIDARVTFPRSAETEPRSSSALDGRGRKHHFFFLAFVFGSDPSSWGSKPI
jgi:hypothetical protein